MKDKLTQKEQILMYAVRDEWINKLNSCPKLNKPKAKKLVDWLYDLAGFKKPLIVFLDSPLALQYACNMSKESQVESQVRPQVFSQVFSQVWSQVRSQVLSQVLSQVRPQVRLQVELQVESQVLSQVWSQVRSQVESQGLKYYDFAYYGSIWDYGWVAYYNFFNKIGIVKHKLFDELKDLLDCGVYDMIQQDNICYVCGMPEYIKRDENNNLHSDTEPAIKWKDGFELYFLNGVAFDKPLFQKVVGDELSFKQLMEIKNVEQRMVAFKMCDKDRILQNAKLIDKSERGNELYLVEGLFLKPAKFVKKICPSTGRVYFEGVSPDVKTADEAVAWQLDISPQEYTNLKLET